MENVSNIDSQCCETTKNVYFKSASRIPSPIIWYTDFRHRDNKNSIEAKTGDALGTAADLYHRVQSSLAHFHFNCIYVDCTTDWSVVQ